MPEYGPSGVQKPFPPVRAGGISFPKLLRQIGSRSGQVRDLIFVRDAYYPKDVKTTGATTNTEGSGNTLAGPPVSFGYDSPTRQELQSNSSTAYAANYDAVVGSTATIAAGGTDTDYYLSSPQIVLPHLPAFQSPTTSRSSSQGRGGHSITGSCKFYLPTTSQLTYQAQLSWVPTSGSITGGAYGDGLIEWPVETLYDFDMPLWSIENPFYWGMSSFGEIEPNDKLLEIENIIDQPADYEYGTRFGDTDPGFLKTHSVQFSGESRGQADRIQFKARWWDSPASKAAWASGEHAGIIEFKLQNTAGTAYIKWSTSNLGDRSSSDWNDMGNDISYWQTVDLPLRDVKTGHKCETGTRPQRTLTAYISEDFHVDRVNLRKLIITTYGVSEMQLKDIYLYKAAEWTITDIKEYKDCYLLANAIRLRGGNSSARRAYG